MSRIEYGALYYLLYPESLATRDRERIKEGKEIFEKARNWDWNKSNLDWERYKRIRNSVHLSSYSYAISSKAIHNTPVRFAPFEEEYQNPVIAEALIFALENNDKKLHKQILRLNKYMKEAYEASYDNKTISLRLYNSVERANKRIESSQEKLKFISRIQSSSYSSLMRLKEEKMEEIAREQKREKSDYDKIKKLNVEIDLLDDLINTRGRKRKRWLVTKRKELNEIIESAEKCKGYKHRYIRDMRSKRNWKTITKNSNRYYSDYFEKARYVLRKLNDSIDMKDRDEKGKETAVPFYVVNKDRLENIKKELQKDYYSEQGSKTK